MTRPTRKVLRCLNLIDPSEPEVTFVPAPDVSPVSAELLKRAAQERRSSCGRKRKEGKKHDNKKPKKNKDRSVASSKWDPNLRYPLPPSGNKGKSVRTVGSLWKG